ADNLGRTLKVTSTLRAANYLRTTYTGDREVLTGDYVTRAEEGRVGGTGPWVAQSQQEEGGAAVCRVTGFFGGVTTRTVSNLSGFIRTATGQFISVVQQNASISDTLSGDHTSEITYVVVPADNLGRTLKVTSTLRAANYLRTTYTGDREVLTGDYVT